MKYRFRVLGSNPAVDACGASMTSIVNSANFGLNIKVAGEDLIDTTDLAGVSLPLVLNATNGIIAVLSLANTDYLTLSISYPVAKRIYDSTTVYIKTELAGYEKYENTFTIYNYDLGNNPNATNNDSNPITYNPDMDIYMQNDGTTGVGQTIASKFVGYRKPSTKKIHLYDLCSGSDITCEYLNEDGDSVLDIRNGDIINEGSINLRQSRSANSLGCTTAEVSIIKSTWKPDFNATIVSDICGDDGCVSTEATTTVEVDIDYGNLTSLYQDDVLTYSYRSQQLVYNVFDYNGDLSQQVIKNFSIVPPPFVYDKSTYAANITIPDKGDYVVQVCLVEIGELTDTVLTDGNLVIDQWYKITNSSGSDFTDSGAADNNKGTEFVANDVTPTWVVGGELTLLTSFAQCCKNFPVKVCDSFEIVKTNCGSYTYNNLSFSTNSITISKLQKDKNFTVYKEIENIPLDALGKYEFTLADDGVYKLQNVNDKIVVIIVDCGIRDCTKAFLDKIICEIEDTCKDYYKDVYDFTSFVLLVGTYFNMINAEYSLGFIYTALDNEKITELYDIDQVLNRLTEYCGSNGGCSSGCGGTCDKCKH